MSTASDSLRRAPASFRDRTSHVFLSGDRILRFLNPKAAAEWQIVASSNIFSKNTRLERIIPTEVVDMPYGESDQGGWNWVICLEHQRVPLISYPYEWCFSMLKDAALLQLDLLNEAIEEGLIMKDATPYNIQWQGSQPCFIDIPSIIQWEKGMPWVGYRQFCMLFLYPLLLQAYKNIAFQPWLRGRLEGIEPGECVRVMSWFDYFRPGVLSDVYLHSQADQRLAHTTRLSGTDLQTAGFSQEMLKANFSRLRNVVEKLHWKQGDSAWSGYVRHNSYAEADSGQKQDFVRTVCASRPRRMVWDLGSNTGTFSRLAAQNAEYVLALDSDALSIDLLYQSLKAEGVKNILPLVYNLADPSPGVGWAGTERQRLDERSQPDLILCLALIHHIVIRSHIPLGDFIQRLADFKADMVIEFVGRNDPMTRFLLRNKDDDYWDYDQGYFEESLHRYFISERVLALSSGTRTLYYVHPRNA